MTEASACTNITTIDHAAIEKVRAGEPLETKSHIECGHTLARQVYDDISPKTVLIQDIGMRGISYGSGFFVGKDGDEVVTDAHVINGAIQTVVQTTSGEVFSAKVIDEDDVNDLAHLKIIGISKDPSRSIEIGDSAPLKPGTPMLAVGHPGAVHSTVLSAGKVLKQGPLVDVQSPGDSDMSKEIAGFAAHLHSKFVTESLDAVYADKINMDTPLWHGGSGEAIVDDKKILRGIGQTIDLHDSTFAYAAPAGKISDLLNRKTNQFHFTYRSQSAYDRNSDDVGWHTAEMLGAAALVGAISPLRRVAAPIVGLANAPDALKNFEIAAKPDLFAPRSKFIAEGLADVAAMAGGVMSLIPRTRALGIGLVAAKFVYDQTKPYQADSYFLKDVERTNGDLRKPFHWDDDAH